MSDQAKEKSPNPSLNEPLLARRSFNVEDQPSFVKVSKIQTQDFRVARQGP